MKAKLHYNRPQAGGTLVLFLFWLLWTAFTGFVTSVMLLGIVRQCWAYTYLPVEATLLERSLEPHRKSVVPHVKYRYTVDGKEYESTRLDWMNVGSGNKDLVESELPRAAIGENVTAYYSPKSPENAVLNRGPQPMDLLAPLFLLPFNAVSFGGFLFLLDAWRSRALGRPWLRMRVRETLEGWEARFYGISPLMAATMAAGASAFLMIFAVLFIPGEISGYVRAIFGWSVVLVIALAVWWKVLHRYTTLRMDAMRGTGYYTFSPENTEDAYALEEFVCVKETESTTFDSKGRPSTAVVISVETRSQQSLTLVTLHDVAASARLRAWLEERLHLEGGTE